MYSSYLEKERVILSKPGDELSESVSIYPCRISLPPFIPPSGLLPAIQIPGSLYFNAQGMKKGGGRGYVEKIECDSNCKGGFQIPINQITVEIVNEEQREDSSQHEEKQSFDRHPNSNDSENKTSNEKIDSSKGLSEKTFEQGKNNGRIQKKYSFEKKYVAKKKRSKLKQGDPVDDERHGFLSKNWTSNIRNFSPEARTLSKNASFDTIKHAPRKRDYKDNNNSFISKSSAMEKISQKKEKDFLYLGKKKAQKKQKPASESVDVIKNGNTKIRKCNDPFRQKLGGLSTQNLPCHTRLYEYKETKAGSSSSNMKMAFNPGNNLALNKYQHLFTDTNNYPKARPYSNRHFVKSSWDTDGDITNLRNRVNTNNGHTTGYYSGQQSFENSLAFISNVNLHTVPNNNEDTNLNSISIV